MSEGGDPGYGERLPGACDIFGADMDRTRAPRSAWIVVAGSFALLFVLLVINVFTGVWPRPWILIELVFGLSAAMGLLFGLQYIAARHPLGPTRADGWLHTSGRYWIWLVSLAMAPVAMLALPGEWNQSHALAILYGAGGLTCAAIAYLLGRPWPIW